MIPTLIYQKSSVCHANQPNSSHGSHVGATDFSWALATNNYIVLLTQCTMGSEQMTTAAAAAAASPIFIFHKP